MVIGWKLNHKIDLKVNGKQMSAEAESRMLLVHFLRETLNLTGTHIGCDTGHCGACTVITNGKAVKSCMILAPQASGSEILTVEGLADGDELHPLQEAFHECHGLQCGYCTPGLLMSSLYLLSKNPNPTEDEIRRGIDGNFCRCTGYVHVVDSIKSAAKLMKEKDSLQHIISRTV